MPKVFNRNLKKVLTAAGVILVTGICAAWTLQVREGKKSAFISAAKMNVVYIGLNNPLSIISDDYSPGQLEIRSVGGTVRPGDEGYYIDPDKSARECTVQLIDTANKKLVAEQHFRIRPLPKPEVYLGTNPGPSINLGELQAAKRINSGLGIAIPFEGIVYNVIGYTFTHAPKGGKGFYQVAVEGNNITAEIKDRIASVIPGDIIIISDVHLVGPGGKRDAPGSFFTVK